jgi:uncharacterized protein YjbI with pentapeptide repeats
VETVHKKYFAPGWLLLILLSSSVFTNTVNADCDDKRSPGMDWSGCKKMNKMLDNQNFSSSKFDNTNLSLSNLDNSNFTGASLVKTDLTRASLNQSIFSHADLTKSVGYRASFNGAVFLKTSMTKSEFSRASFQGAKFTEVDWSRAELGRANFSNARLKDVNFEYSNLSRARFNEAILTNVNFSGAYTYLTHFENVDLSMTSKLSQAQLEKACGNDKTQLPQGLERPASWHCTE